VASSSNEGAAPHVRLFADCIPVRGAAYSAIYDLGRRRLLRFPSAYMDLLERVNGRTMQDASEGLDSERAELLGRFVQYLLDNEVAVLSAIPGAFPALPQAWNSVQSAIIDYDRQRHDHRKLIAELDALGCAYLQVRVFSDLLSLEDLADIARVSSGSSLRSIELLVPYCDRTATSTWARFVREHLIVAKIVVHGAPRNEVVNVDLTPERVPGLVTSRAVYFISDAIGSADACGRVDRKTLRAPSVPLFFESRGYNSCLNRKLGIDVDGHIRQCPSLPRSFGDHRAHTLADVVSLEPFRAIWGIAKDQVETCRDCEYRHACMDCRAFTADPANPYSKPAGCTYDPWTGQWAETAPDAPGFEVVRLRLTGADRDASGTPPCSADGSSAGEVLQALV
jgi:SPASM domain peptide maturase of grasp-with-spasm system